MINRYKDYTKLKFDYPAERVLRITFDRPETFNSVDAETHTQMTDMWVDINRDPDINAILVTGAGKAFSSGGDFGLIERMAGNMDEVMKTWKEAKDLVYNIINCNKPIISALNGPAAGAGLVVGILADISIAFGCSRGITHTRSLLDEGDVLLFKRRRFRQHIVGPDGCRRHGVCGSDK
ncbi:MAG: enoyl-CoA hydratase/isomerase family protein, partial [Rhodospirillales bacterium]|nr:enoyl-CoA hydratase/isomerase family protein [Rhodospirillales bacterium]